MSEEEEYYSTDLAQWRIWLPHVLASDGDEFFYWSRARQLSGILERALRRHYFKSDSPALLEDDLLSELEELQQNLARNDGFMRERNLADWHQVQAQLRRANQWIDQLLT